MNDDRKLCKHCMAEINRLANVCFQCQRSQGKFSFSPEVINIISIILSLSMVVLAAWQLNEAVNQRKFAESGAKDAESAANDAKSAVTKAENAYNFSVLAEKGSKQASDEAIAAKDEAIKANDEAKNTVKYLRTNTKYLLEMYANSDAILSESSDTKKVDIARKKLEEFAIPDKQKREKWKKDQMH